MPDQFEPILKGIYDHLTDGATNRRSPLHTPVVGTGDGDMRVMVLRHFDQDTMTLRFHTDARSPKVAAIKHDPDVGILFYDPEAKVQIRVRGTGRVEKNGTAADAAWAQSTPFARRCYLAEAARGASSEVPLSGLPDWAEGIVPTEADLAPARENFAVIMVSIRAFDWLFLANTGHRRALFEFVDGKIRSRWLAP